MTSFSAKRVRRDYSEKIAAPRSEVFPLLCPVKEYEWLDGWTCDVIYSDSGVVEKDCVFKTGFLGAGDEIWVTTKYDVENYAKEFVVINPSSRVMRFDVTLRDCGEDLTEAIWTLTITALNEHGNMMVEHYTEEVHQHTMGMLAKSLKHYCETGEKLVLSAHPT
jgi:hypothetical protein